MATSMASSEVPDIRPMMRREYFVATCISRQSRNRHVGEELGKGRTIEEITTEMNMVAEGVKTVSTVVELADEHDVTLVTTGRCDLTDEAFAVDDREVEVLVDGAGKTREAARLEIDQRTLKTAEQEQTDAQVAVADGGDDVADDRAALGVLRRSAETPGPSTA